MNRNSRTIAMILSALARLETDASSNAFDAIGLLDEITRLRRKWDVQVAAKSQRRTKGDFAEMKGWLLRWSIAAKRILVTDDLPPLREAILKVSAEIQTWSSGI